MKLVKGSKTKVAASNQADDISLVTLSAKDYLFTQNTICSSVCLEPNTHLIYPFANNLVNSNGETWSNPVLKKHYSSFIGAWNYLNHVQIPAKSIGFIADAALRKLPIEENPEFYVYYVDILVCTHRENSKIVEKIALGDIMYLSMGCDVLSSTCSKCGHLVDYSDGSNPDLCQHLLVEKGKSYQDKNGTFRVCAELLGDESPNGCTFTEASFLTQTPAFGGAVKRNILPIEPDQSVEISLPSWALQKPALKKYLG